MKYRASFVATSVAFAAAMTAGSAAQVLVVGPTRAEACYESARAERSSKATIDECTQSLRADPLTLRDRAATNVNRGILHMYARDYAAALADYDQALRMQPAMAEAHVNRGIALLRLGADTDEALRSLTRGIDQDTSQPEVAYYMRGIAYELLGDPRKAYYDYRKAASLKPDWQDPKTQLGRFSVVRK